MQGCPTAGFLQLCCLQALKAAQVPCTRLNFPSLFPFQYKGANIQLLDLPGIIEGAAQGWLISAFVHCRDLPSTPSASSLGSSNISGVPGLVIPALAFQTNILDLM